jgi:hypothetical protein
MLGWLKRSRELAVEFCDRCAKVCDAGCRASTLREQALERTFRFGVRA